VVFAFVGAQDHGLGGQRSSDVIGVVVQGYLASASYGAGQFVGSVLYGWVFMGEASWADAVAGGGDVQLEGVVGSVVVVVFAEDLEALLGFGEVGPVVPGEQFVFEGSVEAFVLALGLRVTGASVEDLDALTQEPEAQEGQIAGWGAPGRTVVAEDLVGQSVAYECVGEEFLNGPGGLVGACVKADEEA
jgi:hypothetical protein